MNNLEKIVVMTTPPASPHGIWYNPETKQLSIFSNGEWVVVNDDVLIAVPVDNTVSAQEMAPNVVYIFDNRTEDLTITLTPAEDGMADEYHCFIVTGGMAPTITWPNGLVWGSGEAPTIQANKTYEVSIFNNIALYLEI